MSNELTLDLACGHSMKFELPESFETLEEMEKKKFTVMYLCYNHLFLCAIEQTLKGAAS